MRVNSIDVEHQLGVLGVSRIVDLLSVCVSSHFLIFVHSAAIEIVVVHESVTLEFVAASEILIVVKNNEGRGLVFVEVTFLSRCSLLEVLLPLGLEEYHHFAGNVGVILGNVLGSGLTFGELSTVYHSSHSNF